MENIYDYIILLCPISLILLLYVNNYNSNSNNNLVKNSKIYAEKIISNFFKKEIEKNNNLSLDKLILKFENSKEKDLNIFAKQKGRTKENYYKTYKKYYIKAKNNLNINNS